MSAPQACSLLSPELDIPLCEKGIGAVIHTPHDAALIDGVRIECSVIHPDDRGYFLEVMRSGQGLVAAYPASRTQVSASVSYPGIIKAFHYHVRQTDCWIPVAGMLQVALVDLRRRAPTFGTRNTLYVGTLRPWRLLIPPGVAHGYKVISKEPAVLVYLTDQFYDPADEGRIPYHHPGINYDWELQHR
ncbi:MAG: dTDP-4-dehydrorhamnose 3,5-epimerase family protein [Bryobacterales bacterium]|nr:dTDP-4-dehydrorhamnose 3,5-epimerase family protein [Bryobacteraceae bacterium]MDW8355362.1 dTDP-4-dehydrorhamnose 3,5-epimerase family protein [Bryobacterales bacterium]